MIIVLQDKLRYLREHQELSQKDVADKLGIARTTYNRYETGQHEPDLKTLKALAALFHVTTNYLLEADELESDGLVDLQNFLLHGNYTIFSKFPDARDRKKLVGIVSVMFADEPET